MSLPAAQFISIGQLEQAINHARAIGPSSGREASLSKQVARLADIYGRLIFERQQQVRADELHPDDLLLVRGVL